MGILGASKKVAKSAPAQDVARSMKDYLEGVAKVHSEIAATPGAQRVDPMLRQAQAKMSPKRVLEQYNENQLFGKTASGEPLRGVIQERPERGGFRLHEDIDLPDQGRFMLFPESKIPYDRMDSATFVAPSMDFYKKIPHVNDADYAVHLTRQLTGSSDPRAFDPRMYNIFAMNVTPPEWPGHWTEGLRSKGKEMYGALYDMMRAGGHGNFADTLTPVNSVRRLGNVGSHGIGHGNLGFISPIDESIGYSTQLPGFNLKGGDETQQYLDSLFLTGLRPRMSDVVEDLRRVNPRDLSNMSDQEKLGLLYLREAQLSGTFGPPTQTGLMTRIGDVLPFDRPRLNAIAEPYVQSNLGNLKGAFGPSTLGRQTTTEHAIRRMMKGETPEEIAEDLIRLAPEEGFRDRYAKGGLVRARG